MPRPRLYNVPLPLVLLLRQPAAGRKTRSPVALLVMIVPPIAPLVAAIKDC
ncbi:MAG: hypothetical protein LBT04_07340 [Prevotellaceae bacterium]|nr:hypothetical protein [Prevotellaceae bacterium]